MTFAYGTDLLMILALSWDLKYVYIPYPLKLSYFERMSQENLILLHANNKCADEPVNQRICFSLCICITYEGCSLKLSPDLFPVTYRKIVSEYDQEIPQSQTADNPVAPRGRAAQPSLDTRKTN